VRTVVPTAAVLALAVLGSFQHGSVSGASTALLSVCDGGASGNPTVSLTLGAHPGHGSKVVMGPLREVTPDAIVVEVLDTGGGGTTRVRVQLQPGTRFRIDKERLTSLDGMIGQRAIVSVDWEDDDRGGQTLTATEVRFTRAKQK
jgi:hypothetical protein